MSSLLKAIGEKSGLDKTQAFHNHLKQKAWENGVPLMGSFELTPQCTLDCKMCYVHLRKDQMKQPELETEQWLSLIDQACDAGMMFATLTGGECLMYPGFKQIYRHLQDRGVLVTVFTNATLLDEDTVLWLAKRPPQRIQISVYGSSPAGYEAVTGSADAFYKVDKALDLIKKAGIPFSIAITVSKQMLPDFEAIYKYCLSKEPLTCNVATMPFQARSETGRRYDDYAPSIDEQVGIFKSRMKYHGVEFPPQICDDEIQSPAAAYENHTEKGISCTAGRNSFSLSWDGKMLACATLPFAQGHPLEDGFANAWSYINKRAREYHMPVECAGCPYYKVCSHCPAAHWLGVGEGRCNPSICEEGKRMVIEGLRKL